MSLPGYTQHTGRMLTAAFGVTIPWGKHLFHLLCLQVFIFDFGLWLTCWNPDLAPFLSSATACLGKAGNSFLPLFPNGNLNQSLINSDCFVCLACRLLGEQFFSHISSDLLPISALALGYCYRISTIKNKRTFPQLVSLLLWQSHPQWKYCHWLVDPQFWLSFESQYA